MFFTFHVFCWFFFDDGALAGRAPPSATSARVMLFSVFYTYVPVSGFKSTAVPCIVSKDVTSKKGRPTFTHSVAYVTARCHAVACSRPPSTITILSNSRWTPCSTSSSSKTSLLLFVMFTTLASCVSAHFCLKAALRPVEPGPLIPQFSSFSSLLVFIDSMNRWANSVWCPSLRNVPALKQCLQFLLQSQISASTEVRRHPQALRALCSHWRPQCRGHTSHVELLSTLIPIDSTLFPVVHAAREAAHTVRWSFWVNARFNLSESATLIIALSFSSFCFSVFPSLFYVFFFFFSVFTSFPFFSMFFMFFFHVFFFCLFFFVHCATCKSS